MPDEELKSLLKRNLEVAEDTNRMIHAMHRRAVWGGIIKLIWWVVAIVIIPLLAYYLYLAPLLKQYQDVFSNVQGSSQEMQNFKDSFGSDGAFSDFLNTLKGLGSK